MADSGARPGEAIAVECATSTDRPAYGAVASDDGDFVISLTLLGVHALRSPRLRAEIFTARNTTTP